VTLPDDACALTDVAPRPSRAARQTVTPRNKESLFILRILLMEVVTTFRNSAYITEQASLGNMKTKGE